MSKKQNGNRYCTDGIAMRIFKAMSSDFARMHGEKFLEPTKAIKSPKDVRLYVYGNYRSTTVPRFKAWYQLENIFKKYIFQDDVYTENELKEMTINEYVKFQENRSIYNPISYRSFLVLQEARKIARSILGPCDGEALLQKSRFGRNSSIGCSFANSYLDYKLSTKQAFTGTVRSSRVFYEDYLKTDPLLGRILQKNAISHPTQHESLNLTLVPKTWKTLRPITPLTLLALHRSYGIGEAMTERLRETVQLDIAKQQARHRVWIKKFSKTRTHATVDLTSASNSITSWLLNRILPRDWYRALADTLTHKLKIDKVNYYTESVLPMGNGATFPCETLIFYSLVKAVGNLLGRTKGIYSVYGDDLIYPTSIHRHVQQILAELGIAVNNEKTFVHSYFRESCGADYYAGVDVRPFFLPNGGCLSKSQYILWLYKSLNALSRRWSHDELPNTFCTLLIELSHIAGKLFRVPPSYPDTAGWKCHLDDTLVRRTSALPWAPIAVVFLNGTRNYGFSYLKQTSEKRSVQDAEPFLWQKLRTLTTGSDKEFVDMNRVELDVLPKVLKRVLLLFALDDASPKDALTWKSQKVKRTYYDGKGKRRVKVLTKQLAYIADKQNMKLEVCHSFDTSQSREAESIMSDWF